jgi:hypothetical protein
MFSTWLRFFKSKCLSVFARSHQAVCANSIHNSSHSIEDYLTLSLAAPFAPPCLEALGLIGPRKKEKKTAFDDVN